MFNTTVTSKFSYLHKETHFYVVKKIINFDYLIYYQSICFRFLHPITARKGLAADSRQLKN